VRRSSRPHRQPYRTPGAVVRKWCTCANGPKSNPVLRDAINNQIEITKNAQYCLVFDRQVPADGAKSCQRGGRHPCATSRPRPTDTALRKSWVASRPQVGDSQ